METRPVPVYYSAQNVRCERPVFLLDREQARAWRDQGKAYFVDHGKALRLLPQAEEEIERLRSRQAPSDAVVSQRDESCYMGESVMNGNAQDELWAKVMVRSWNPRIARQQHFESLKKFQNLQNLGA